MKRSLKTVNFLDVHDKDITPAIYTLLFSIVELEGNDMTYEIHPFDYEITEEMEQAWKDRLARGYKNCYFDEAEMKKFIENPMSLQEAIDHFQAWLIERGVEVGESVQAKIWW